MLLHGARRAWTQAITNRLSFPRQPLPWWGLLLLSSSAAILVIGTLKGECLD